MLEVSVALGSWQTKAGGLEVLLLQFSDFIFQIFRVLSKRHPEAGGARMGLRACLSRLPWARYAIDTILYFTGKHLPQIS